MWQAHTHTVSTGRKKGRVPLYAFHVLPLYTKTQVDERVFMDTDAKCRSRFKCIHVALSVDKEYR